MDGKEVHEDLEVMVSCLNYEVGKMREQLKVLSFSVFCLAVAIVCVNLAIF